MAKIGINGGSFDPIHFGHLRPALEVLHALQLDEMRFMPAYQTVHKTQPMVSAEQRCEMVQRAIAPIAQFTLERLEIERGGPSYMVDSLTQLQQSAPQNQWVLMMGMDAFEQFDQWHRYQDILQLANLVVTFRPGAKLQPNSAVQKLLAERQVSTLHQPSGQILLQLVTQLDISSTAIRQKIQQNEPLNFLMPESVIDYIEHNQLYRTR
ncbi:nicotinate-nucleotide adenylyltransferase [Galenea microaerophila]